MTVLSDFQIEKVRATFGATVRDVSLPVYPISRFSLFIRRGSITAC